MARHCKETHRRDDAGAHALALINPSPLLLACQFADALAAMPDMKSVARTDKDIALFESHKIIIASLFCQFASGKGLLSLLFAGLENNAITEKISHSGRKAGQCLETDIPQLACCSMVELRHESVVSTIFRS